jgi:hypothetical protein
VVSVAFLQISTWAPDFRDAIRRHYTGSEGAPPGKKLAWRIHERGRIIGWIGLGEPSYKLAPRRRLGLLDARPLAHTVNCFIYRLEGTREESASRILRAWHQVAIRDWELRYGWKPSHWETLVGQGVAGNLGACFKRSGYRRCGLTTGRSARRPAGRSHGARVWMDATPKILLYRGPLDRVPAPIQGGI